MSNSRTKTSSPKAGSWAARRDSTVIHNNRNPAKAARPILQQKKANSAIKIVDLFCGCGGLSLGFDLHKGNLQFSTVLGVDNDAAALRVFNDNVKTPGANIATGRKADLSWFTHPSEALLYYLSHYAEWEPDPRLALSLEAAGYKRFLAELHWIDLSFAAKLTALSTRRDREIVGTLGADGATIALVKSCFAKLGLTSLKNPRIQIDKLPWSTEYTSIPPMMPVAELSIDHAIEVASAELWDNQIDRLRKASTSIGRGQHSTVAAKAGAVFDYLKTPTGEELKHIWVNWRASRDTARANFCLKTEPLLRGMYTPERRVDMVLGGPPCKGWSRIGRAVIERLREQGVHAWASHDYGDERNELLKNYVLFIDALQPAAFIFENVAHFQSSLRTPAGIINAATELQRALNPLGDQSSRYEVASQIVSAREHAIPQDRKRYILVGLRSSDAAQQTIQDIFDCLTRYKTEVNLSAALSGLGHPGIFKHGSADSSQADHVSPAYTMIDTSLPNSELAYLEWVRQAKATGETPPNSTDGHVVRAPRADDAELFRIIAPGLRWMDYDFSESASLRGLRDMLHKIKLKQIKRPDPTIPSLEDVEIIEKQLNNNFVLRVILEGLGQKLGGEPHHLLQLGYLSKKGDHHGDWLERLSPHRPCKTIVAHIGKDTYGYIHPTQTRALSIREAARVQSFPDFFHFRKAGIVDAYSMIGNAVPPMLAHHFAAAFEQVAERRQLFYSAELHTAAGG